MKSSLTTPRDLEKMFKASPEGYTIGLKKYRYIVGVSKETNGAVVYANADEIDFQDLASRLSGLVYVSMMRPELPLSLGWWTDPATGNVWYDVVQGFNDEAEAIKRAQEFDEIAYYDAQTQTCINTPKK